MIIPMIDWLSFSVDIENYEELIEINIQKLQDAKDYAKEISVNKLSEKSIIQIGSMNFNVMPNGTQGYAFILNNDEYQIKIAQFRSKKRDYYPIMIIIHSQALWSFGPEEAYRQIANWIEKEIGVIIANKVSRVDLCCHTDLIKDNLIEIGRFKGLFKIDEVHINHENRKTSAINYGSRKSSIYCRIYDKKLEISKTRKKLWFYLIWQKYGYVDKAVWNIEFELKRDFFLDHNLESVDDVFCISKKHMGLLHFKMACYDRSH